MKISYFLILLFNLPNLFCLIFFSMRLSLILSTCLRYQLHQYKNTNCLQYILYIRHGKNLFIQTLIELINQLIKLIDHLLSNCINFLFTNSFYKCFFVLGKWRQHAYYLRIQLKENCFPVIYVSYSFLFVYLFINIKKFSRTELWK